MLERKIYSRLLEWKSRKHKSLLVSGQRQVGKTFIIDAFGRSEYDHCIHIDFNEDPEMGDYFEGSISAEEIIRKLTLQFGKDSIVDGKTLIFLDEIQECPRAYSSLKQFTEYGKVDVIASGSLLGIKMPGSEDGKEPLAPMGYEETITMNAMDFEEFLWAMGISGETIESVRECIRDSVPIDDALYDRLTQLFREYMIVGGMPEAVNEYSHTKDFRAVGKIQDELVSYCIRDINRYNSGIDRVKTLECFESIPYQLADTNKKFKYSRIKGEGSRRSSERFMENLIWIKYAGYGLFCYGIEQPALPLKKYVQRNVFKVYLSDTGMLLSMYGNKARTAVYNGDHGYNMGALTENAVADSLSKCGYEATYYRKDKGEGKMELDFVLEFWEGVAVIEVKSGRDRESRSLEAVARTYNVSRRIMLEESNVFVDEKGVEHFPLFACAFIDSMDKSPNDSPFD